MANRYAVATGNWNETGTWSDSDGGAPGASAPVNGDTVYLTATSGAITVTLTASAACTVLNCTGFTGTLALSVYGLTVAGDCTLPSGMTITFSSPGSITVSAAATVTGGTASAVQLYLTGTGAVTLNSAGTTWALVKVSGGAKTVTLASALACTVLNLYENYGSVTFAGAYDITAGTLGVGYIAAVSATFVSGRTVTVTGTLFSLSSSVAPSTIKSSTASSSFALTFSGSAANCRLAGMIMTDVDASGSTGGSILNWCGGTLTRTTGVYNATMDSFPAVADVESGVEYGGVDDAAANRLTGTLSASSGAGAWAHRMIGGGF